METQQKRIFLVAYCQTGEQYPKTITSTGRENAITIASEIKNLITPTATIKLVSPIMPRYKDTAEVLIDNFKDFEGRYSFANPWACFSFDKDVRRSNTSIKKIEIAIKMLNWCVQDTIVIVTKNSAIWEFKKAFEGLIHARVTCFEEYQKTIPVGFSN